MQYISKYDSFPLLTVASDVAYLFDNGQLIVGDATTTSGAGFVIDPNFSAIDGTALAVTVTTGSSDLEKVGLNTYFWEAPDLLPTDNSNAPLTVGLWYRVVTGPITHNSVVYNVGDRFKAAATSFTGSGKIVRFDLPVEHYRPSEDNMRAEAFLFVHTAERETTWDSAAWAPVAVSPTADL